RSLRLVAQSPDRLLGVQFGNRNRGHQQSLLRQHRGDLLQQDLQWRSEIRGALVDAKHHQDCGAGVAVLSGSRNGSRAGVDAAAASSSATASTSTSTSASTSASASASASATYASVLALVT